jgi:(p)ppGpp synthase/HD superfamily hydrolase
MTNTHSQALQSFQKSRIALYYWMLGKGFVKACEAMTYAERLHDGVRKDKVTPEFAHQVWIANYLRTLPLDDVIMELCLIVAFLHDTSEDKGVSFEEISKLFGDVIADLVNRMTKKFRGVHVETDTYFERLAEKLVSALVKGVDRLHNIASMVDVFTIEKQKNYILETLQRHIPMLKLARKNFPRYEQAFENIKLGLEEHISLIQKIHLALEKV